MASEYERRQGERNNDDVHGALYAGKENKSGVTEFGKIDTVAVTSGTIL